ncbi:MAG: RloB family protein [Thermoguttaceae bacterium]
MKESKNRYARKKPSRTGERVLIVVEGDSEKSYFEAVCRFFQLTGTTVVISDNADGTDPIHLRDHALILNKKSGPFDELWLVYDLEAINNITRRSQAKVVKQSKKSKGICFAESDPSFEFWLILHFEYTSKSFSTPDEVEKHLLAKHWPKYSKGCVPTQNILDRITNQACANAVKLRKYLEDSQTEMPKTDIDMLINSLTQKSRDAKK